MRPYFCCSFSVARLRLTLVVLLLLSLQRSTGGQETSPGVTLRSDTNLVLVDVVVTEKNRSIHGLDKSHFRVQEDGKDRPIASFEEHSAPDGASVKKAPTLPPNTYSNATVYPPGEAVNILLLDGLNTPVGDQIQVRRQMIEFAGKMPAGTPMAIFTLASRLRLLQGFTRDSVALVTALQNPKLDAKQSVLLDTQATQESMADDMAAMGASPAAVAAAQQFEADTKAFQTDSRVRITLDAMEQLGRYLNGIPGRKNLIWFSGSFPIALDPDSSLDRPFDVMRSYGPQLRETDALLAAARVAVYPIDARGLMNLPSFDAGYRTPPTSSINPASGPNSPMGKMNDKFTADNFNEHTSMAELAQETGGRAFVNTNDFQGSIANVLEQGSSYYTLSYEPGSKQDDGKFHKIKVQVSGGSYALAYRRGYFADKGKTTPDQAAMTGAIERGAPPATQIVFHTRVLPSSDAAFKGDPQIESAPGGEMSATLHGTKQRYVVDMRVDVSTIRFDSGVDGVRAAKMEMALVAYDADGKRLNLIDRAFALTLKPDDYHRLLAPGLSVRSVIDLPHGSVYLRVVVRQLGAERIGSLEVPLVVG